MNLHFEFQKCTKHLKTRLATASVFCLAADKSTDIAQLCIWVIFRNFLSYKRFVGNSITCFTKYSMDIFAPCSSPTLLIGISSMTRKHKVPVSEMWKNLLTFWHLHLSDTFIQSDLQCIQAIHFCLSLHVFPGNRTHNLCSANAML